jgi:hypothetical protein
VLIPQGITLETKRGGKTLNICSNLQKLKIGLKIELQLLKIQRFEMYVVLGLITRNDMKE